ncbi:hypothetical protein I2I05_14680 [Hymenobacter sp. BT683]|uniref:Uncharacterized protein n=1 Tax=Hymenobacter jeongseonensis TaxID=2791027 RepID=A0ABS0IKF3_9BACT|nr:hypothetical protein [Hymenobacter jeongseonensis]MBF9238647.1 hypothetical protein [Hymenobacter jeongseonensis]
MRLLFLGILALLLTSCEDSQSVYFSQPFLASAPNLKGFPARHQGWYIMPDDSTRRLLITPTMVWSETMWTFATTVQKLDSLKLNDASKKLGIWHPHNTGSVRLRPGQADTLWLDEWARDTVCALTPDFKGRVRWYRGAYYVSQPGADEQWNVERLLLDGRRLSWQRLGNDTLRLAVLATGAVRRMGSKDHAYWLLTPRTRRQEQQIARYAGLWVPWREMVRQ